MTENSEEKLVIRQEREQDRREVFRVIEEAFRDAPHSGHDEQFLVERLRRSDAFIPELSLLAESDRQVTGHILLTRVKIISGDDAFDSLALAPVSVRPEYQNQGIGGRLIRKAHELALRMGHQSVVLIGHEDYYPRFGYRRADLFGIRFPFEVPEVNCMVVELTPGSLSGVSGTVEYPREFFSQ